MFQCFIQFLCIPFELSTSPIFVCTILLWMQPFVDKASFETSMKNYVASFIRQYYRFLNQNRRRTSFVNTSCHYCLFYILNKQRKCFVIAAMEPLIGQVLSYNPHTTYKLLIKCDFSLSQSNSVDTLSKEIGVSYRYQIKYRTMDGQK